MANNEFSADGWSIPRMVEKLWQDTYHGNGKPGSIARIKENEDAIAGLRKYKAEASNLKQVEERLETIENYLKESESRKEKKMNILLAAVIAGLIGIIVDILSKHVR